MWRGLLALTASLVLVGCAAPDAKITHGWGFSDLGCEPYMRLTVEGGPGTTVRLVHAGGADGESAAQWVRQGTAWEAQFPWRGPSSGGHVELRLERDGKTRTVTYQVPAHAPDMHLWRKTGGGAETPLLYATLALQVAARPGEAGQGFTDSGKGAAARIEAGTMVFDIPVCHVAEATSPEGQVQVGTDSLAYRVPLARFLDVRIGASGFDAVRLPVDVRAADGRNAKLVVEVSSVHLAEALLDDVAAAPLKSAPAFTAGAPLLLVPEDSLPELIRPAETALGDVAAIAVTRASSPIVQVCDYAREGQEKVDKILTRTRHDIAVSVREVRTGRLIASKTFIGSTPPPCPPRIQVEQFGLMGVTSKDLEGSAPTLDVIRAWLKGL